MFRWRAVALAGFVVAGFAGCSGKSERSVPATGNTAGLPAAGGSDADAGEGGFGATGGSGAGTSNRAGASGAAGVTTGGGFANGGASGRAGGAASGGSAGLAALGGNGGVAGTTVSVPVGWSCQAAKYADGKSCDCGCGVSDPDCKDASLESCDACNLLGGCAHGPCPSDVDPDDNTRCLLPATWLCGADAYGNGVCDCGCGALDVDCSGKKASACAACPFDGCATDAACTGVDPNDNTVCTTPPSTWTCDASLYRDGSTCNCGCGVWDPDCSGRDLAACDSCNDPGGCSRRACPGTVNATSNERCDRGMPPDGWTCQPAQYADGVQCDCGCGLPDPDCVTDSPHECVTCACGQCPQSVDQKDPSQCAPAPAGWTCPAADYATGSCHCGCGVMDPACLPNMYCQVCEGCSYGNCELIDESDITKCSFVVPSAWTCTAESYGDGVCDCGCGAPDPVCNDITKASCDSCNTQGGCSKLGCDDPQSDINPTDNEACLP